MKKIFILLTIFLYTHPQSFSIGQLLSKYAGFQGSPARSKPSSIPGCIEEENHQCIECQQGFEVHFGFCINILGNHEVPCEGRRYCGNSIPVTSSELSDLSRLNPEATQVINDEVESLTDLDLTPEFHYDYGKTNNQQVNFDEADIVKNDGNFLYVAMKNTVYIVLGNPFESFTLVAKIHIPKENSIVGLFIEENHLAVLIRKFQSIQFSTHVLIYNIKSKNNPQKFREYSFEGQLVTGRKARDGYVYLVLNMPLKPSSITPWYNTNGIRAHVPLSNVYRYKGDHIQKPGYISIISFDLRYPYPSSVAMISLVTDIQRSIYATSHFLYLIVPKYVHDAPIVTIHKIYIRQWKILPFADVDLEGFINNHFNLDEYRYYILRVVTTSAKEGKTEVNVYTLDNHLGPMGQLHILKDHQITSARFNKRKLFLGTREGSFAIVSFKCHYSPQFQGTLHLEGTSTYIHIINNRYIYSFGRSNNENKGLKIWIFDVHRPSMPIQKGMFELDVNSTNSAVDFDHKAFLSHDDYIVLPVAIPENNSFNGALFLKIDRPPNQYDDWIFNLTAIPHYYQGDDFFSKTVVRSTYIKDNIFTISHCLIKVNKEEDPSIYKEIDLCSS